MTAAPKMTPHGEVASWGYFARRTLQTLGEAEVLPEETDTCTVGAWRGKGPSACTQVVEITSGSTIYQQGLAATCKDRLEERHAKPVGGIWWGA